jgi:lysozyme family protein
MNVSRLIDQIILREGGFVDHPDDRGGPTCWGITEKVARAEGYAGAMKDLPRSTAARIYRALYWDRPGFAGVARIAPFVAEELFDTGVNMGPETATSFLQRALNALNRNGSDYPDLAVDRRIGPASTGALAAFLKQRGPAGETVLLRAMNALQGERYIALAEARPGNESFLYGWIANRIG